MAPRGHNRASDQVKQCGLATAVGPSNRDSFRTDDRQIDGLRPEITVATGEADVHAMQFHQALSRGHLRERQVDRYLAIRNERLPRLTDGFSRLVDLFRVAVAELCCRGFA